MEDVKAIKTVLQKITIFSALNRGIRLRSYQVEVAGAIAESVIQHKGYTFVVIFPRQSGKNELQAQIEAYFLRLYASLDGELVKVSPTWKPQSLNAMRRLERVLSRNVQGLGSWHKESGYIYRVGSARIFFLSGSPTANVVGATANTLLECDEAQDVLISKWDKDINPMAASTNATRVFWGTAWTSRTLLARERAALEAEKRDGVRRFFQLTAVEVAREVPAYGRFVQGEIQKLGRNHPMVRTQYFSEEIEAQGGMFTPARVALMQGIHLPALQPQAECLYIFTIDVAGEDEAAGETGTAGVYGSGAYCSPGMGSRGETKLANPKRDSTALTIARIDPASMSDPLIGKPTYRIVQRRLWTGIKQVSLYGQLKALAELWRPLMIVIDATGVGAGMASFLAGALGSVVTPFTFNASSKSKLGWDFLSIIETGRFKDYVIGDKGKGVGARFPIAISFAIDDPYALREMFYSQCCYCEMEIEPGPERKMKWGVPDGTRQADSGEQGSSAAFVHDDLILSAALLAVVDRETWGVAESQIVEAEDPMRQMRGVY